MAKKKKESSTTAKIKELTGVKPEKVTEEQLKKIQSMVDRINQTQMNIGQLESRKHQALHFLAGINDELTLMQQELQKDYGTNDVNIQDGTINYPKENGETDKED
jgi:ppGpp synthetase/RelA/SpoT-type nucleotidyltranferase